MIAQEKKAKGVSLEENWFSVQGIRNDFYPNVPKDRD